MKTTTFLLSCGISLSAAALAIGCGGDVSGTSSTGGNGGTTSSTGGTGTGGATTTGGSGGATTGGSGGTTSSGGSGGASTGGAGGATSADCKAAVAAIAAQTTGVKTCTTLVRLDYQTFTIKGYRIFCDPYAATTEAAARATAQADTGFGQAGQLLSGPTPADEYVLWEPAGDFGGVGVVSARSGKTVFGGGIVWSGTGQISYPATFDPPGLLGQGCTNTAQVPSARGWDLVSAMPLSADKVSAALDVVWGTALPDGLMQGGYLFDAVVLLYPPTVGAFDPGVAEWEVLVNSGWLE